MLQLQWIRAVQFLLMKPVSLEVKSIQDIGCRTRFQVRAGGQHLMIHISHMKTNGRIMLLPLSYSLILSFVPLRKLTHQELASLEFLGVDFLRVLQGLSIGDFVGRIQFMDAVSLRKIPHGKIHLIRMFPENDIPLYGIHQFILRVQDVRSFG
jgi:hypothetical protein